MFTFLILVVSRTFLHVYNLKKFQCYFGSPKLFLVRIQNLYILAFRFTIKGGPAIVDPAEPKTMPFD